MTAELNIDGRRYSFDASAPIDISIPLRFNGPQPNAYGVEPASSVPCEAGALVGDTRRGGSCNFEQHTLIPHCNGTHTECVGHITNERISVGECLRDVFIPAMLVTIEPAAVSGVEDGYSMAIADGDQLITRRQLEDALEGARTEICAALVIRTMPNDESKTTRRYVDEIPPYFTNDAMQFLVERGVRHLLVDMPSVDRLYDEGRLSNHRIFWNIEQGSFETSETMRRRATITELIYVSDDAVDGTYLLNLQIAPFASDASPSRPLLFRILEN